MNILLRLSQLFSKFLERRLIKIFKKKFHKFRKFSEYRKIFVFLALCSMFIKDEKY